MPIRFEGPQPFAPNVIAAYARSQQALQGQQIQARNAEAMARLRAANQAQLAERSDRLADSNMDRVQGALNLQEQLTDREYDRASRERSLDKQLGMEAQAIQFRHASEVIQQQQRAELNSWVQQQDLTFQEKLRLDRMRTAVSEVMNDQTLLPEEREAMVWQLKTGIDVMQQRQQAAQTRMIEQHAKLYEEQANRQKELTLAQQRREALDFPQRLRTEVMPEARAMLEAQVPLDPALAAVNPQAAVQKREQQIQQKAIEMGAYQQFLMDPVSGAWEPIKREAPKAEAALKPQDMMRIAQDVYSGLVKEQQDAAKNETSAGWSNFDEEYERRLATVLKGMTMMNNALKGGGQLPPGAGTGAKAGQFTPGDQLNWPGFDPRNPPEGEPRRLVERTLQKQAEVGSDERIPPEARQAYIAGLGELLNLIAKPDKTDADRKRIAELGAMERPVPRAAPGRQPEPLRRGFETGGFFAGGKQ